MRHQAAIRQHVEQKVRQRLRDQTFARVSSTITPVRGSTVTRSPSRMRSVSAQTITGSPRLRALR